MVEYFLVAMEGEPEVADGSFFALVDEPVEYPVVDESVVEDIHGALIPIWSADTMQEIIVDIVNLQLFEGVVEHGDGVLSGVISHVGHLGGNEEALAGMTLQGNACMVFRLPFCVDWGRVEVVDPMCNGIVYLLIDHLLVYFPVSTLALSVLLPLGGQSHHAIS